MAPKKIDGSEALNIKEVRSSGSGYLFLSEDGKVYGLGTKESFGLNDSSGEALKGLTYVGDFSGFFNDKILNNYNGGKVPIALKGNEIYMTREKQLIFGNNIVEKIWTKVASGVSFFNGYGNCFIDTSNNLWMSGDSRLMGLGTRSESFEDILNYIICEDTNITGKVEKCWQKGSITYVLLKNHELWATGLYKDDNGKIQYPGWNDEKNKSNFVKILDSVDFFDVATAPGGDTSVKFARTINNEFYSWGEIWGSSTGGNYSRSPVYYNKPEELDLSYLGEDVKNISYFCFLYSTGNRSLILTSKGDLFGAGGHGDIWLGGWNTRTEFAKLDLPYKGDEIAIKIASCSQTSAMFLTDKGGVLGYGASSVLGKGSFSSDLEAVQDISSLREYNICDITAGNGYYIAITTDGKVLGTGSNQTGVLGRWIGVDRESPDSRYKKANQWVECPELEL